MRKSTIWTAAGAALLGLLLLEFVPARVARSGEPAPHGKFQLVYHSDTRGYYRPCG